MFATLREFIETRLQDTGASTSEEDQQHAIRLTTAALMVEMMRADFNEAKDERTTIVLLMQKIFDLDEDETHELLDQAEVKVDQTTSLYEFTGLINRTHDEPRKIHIIELLWEVAYADGKLDKYEDHLVRRVADLIHIPHSEFIQAKHRVQERQTR